MTLFQFDLLITGVPARSPTHGALGWCSVGLLRRNRDVIIVDTGGFPYRELLVDRLGTIGVAPENVTDLLITHSHWDHVSNADLFPAANVRIGGEELRWASSLGADDLQVPATYVRELSRQDRLAPISGEYDLAPGLTAVPTPGHTPGHLSYLAVTDWGLLAFTGDAAKNETELMSGTARASLDPAESRRSIARLADLARHDRALLVCGHDRVLRWVGDHFEGVTISECCVNRISGGGRGIETSTQVE